MKTRIIKQSDILSEEDAVNVKGGVSDKITDSAMECSCDCWIGNTNESKPAKPTQPTRPTQP